jgi:chaperone required for assembly of F1-ATPase
MKRFYKQTAVDQGEGGFRVLLDGRPMRTPAKAVLVVPTRDLAEAIAKEWSDIPDRGEINVGHLPLTRLAATGLDRVSHQRPRVVGEIARYAASDLVCYRATDPASLVQRQSALWQPLVDWLADRYGARLEVGSGTTFVTQPAPALATLREAVASHGDLALSALYNLTHVAGSLAIALAVSEGRLAAADAFTAAQLDELYQIERWGADPIAAQRHDGIRRDLAAAARFLALLGTARLKG